MEETTAIAPVSVNNILTQEAGAVACSIQAVPGDRETAAKIYAALNDPEYNVADYINKQIEVQDILIEMLDIEDEDTGEVSHVPRVVLISPDGKSYQAVSRGMFNAVANASRAFGPAPWKPALVFDIKQRNVKNGSMLTARVY